MKISFDASGVLCDYDDRAYPGAVETTAELSRLGHDVYSLSGGSPTDHDKKSVIADFDELSIALNRRFWQSFKPYLCERLRVDVHVDDTLTEIVRLPKNTQGIWMPPSYKTDEEVRTEVAERAPGLTVVRNWNGIRTALGQLAGINLAPL